MCHKLLGDARYHALQVKCDEDLAEQTRAGGCTQCGGRLDSAPYPRKPRGATSALPEEYESRLSFCCAVEGCRKRHTPPSVRFLGRRVYLGAVVVLATAMQQGVTPVRARRLEALFGVSRRTLARWREWWKEAFAESGFWKAAKGLLAAPVEVRHLPLALLEKFGANEEARLRSLLRMLTPLSRPHGYLPDPRF